MQEVTAAEVGIMFDSPDRRPKLQRVFDLLSRPNAAGERVLGRAEFLRLARLIDPTLAKADAAAEAAVWERVREGKDELAFADVDRISVSGALNRSTAYLSIYLCTRRPHFGVGGAQQVDRISIYLSMSVRWT